MAQYSLIWTARIPEPRQRPWATMWETWSCSLHRVKSQLYLLARTAWGIRSRADLCSTGVDMKTMLSSYACHPAMSRMRILNFLGPSPLTPVLWLAEALSTCQYRIYTRNAEVQCTPEFLEASMLITAA